MIEQIKNKGFYDAKWSHWLLEYFDVYCSKGITEVDLDKRTDFVIKQINAPNEFKKIVKGKSNGYKELLAFYFKMKNNTKFELWLSLKEMFHNHADYLRKNLSEEEDSEKIIDRQLKIAKELDSIRSSLSTIENSLFSNSDVAKDVSEVVTLEGYAERYAESFTI